MRLMRGHLLRDLELAAVCQISPDPHARKVAAGLGPDAGSHRAAADQPPYIGLQFGILVACRKENVTTSEKLTVRSGLPDQPRCAEGNRQ